MISGQLITIDKWRKISIHIGKCGHTEEKAVICQSLLWPCMQILFRDNFNKLQKQLKINPQSEILDHLTLIG